MGVNYLFLIRHTILINSLTTITQTWARSSNAIGTQLNITSLVCYWMVDQWKRPDFILPSGGPIVLMTPGEVNADGAMSFHSTDPRTLIDFNLVQVIKATSQMQPSTV
jgi:hypothetical protein